MRSGDLFSGGSVRMYELRFRNIIKCKRFLLHIYNCMFCRVVFINRLYHLYKLSCGDLSGLDRIHFVYGMHWGIILCLHGSDFSDRRLRCWKIFCCFIKFLLQLSCGHLPIIDWLDGLLFVYSWFVLRHFWIVWRDWSLCYGILFGVIGICMFKLSRRYIYCIVVNDSVLKLSGWNLSSIDWLNVVHFMYCWFVLRHHRIICRVSMRCWNILSVFSDSVL